MKNISEIQSLMTSVSTIEYSSDKLVEVLHKVFDRLKPHSGKQRKGRFYEVPTSFDIETTSAYTHDGVTVLDRVSPDDEKVATMWVWSFTIYQTTFIGRTWEQWVECCKTISAVLELTDKDRLIVWVHNLSFEFGFMQHYFDWTKVFAVDSHKPVQCISSLGIEFRCSYILSGYGLAKLGDQLLKYKCKKMVGDLDYHQLRHSKTDISEKELGYIVNDTRLVCCYIQELIEQEGSITKLPLTQTGFVRNMCRDNCYHTKGMTRTESQHQKKFWRYKDLMTKLTIEPDEYLLLRRAFMGGFTHANSFHAKDVVPNVTSWDFSSAYPSVMVCEKYPMSKGEKVNVSRETFYKYLKTYACVFDVRFIGLKPKFVYDQYLSVSHCSVLKNARTNNGRIVSCDECVTTMTEIDFAIMQRVYHWDKIEVANFWIYRKDYLPTDFVKTVLDLYGAKTTLKGVAGKEVEYMHGKGRLNSLYGMTVMDIIQELQIYEGGWRPAQKPDLVEAIEKYNKNYKRFTTYAWGVYVTAYCRRNLWTGIIEMGADYVYADTDSIKHTNTNHHKEYLLWYNGEINRKMSEAMNYHSFDENLWRPKTIKGVEKPLGYWDDTDGFYSRFKSLGAKRYMVEEDGEINITVSGLNKKVTVPWLLEKYEKPFEAFDDNLFVPASYTGKNTHTYFDNNPINYIMVDLNGKSCVYSELSYVHLEPCEYDMSIAGEYLAYITECKEREII